MKTVKVQLRAEEHNHSFLNYSNFDYRITIDGQSTRRLDGPRLALLKKYADFEWNGEGMHLVVEKEVYLPEVLVNSFFLSRRSRPLVDVIHVDCLPSTSDFFLDEHWSDSALDTVRTSQGLTVQLTEQQSWGDRRGQGGIGMSCSLRAVAPPPGGGGDVYTASEMFRDRFDPSKDRWYAWYGTRIIYAYLAGNSVVVQTNKKSYVFLHK